MAAGEAFTAGQLTRIETALDAAAAETGLRFSVFVGEVGERFAGDPVPAGADASRTAAERMHAALGPSAPDAVLVVVAPASRRLEIVTGELARTRLGDRACALAALSMTTAFDGGDVVGGLVTGLRMMAESAGRETAGV